MSTVRVLVAVASKHGSTAEIGRVLARELPAAAARRGVDLSAIAIPAQQQPDPTSFDAVVIGSAVYFGSWLESAREYATHYAGALRGRPVWLFSSGPIGEPPFPPDEPHDAAPLTAVTGACNHRVFPGRLDPSLLTFGERSMVTAMRAPLGDFRDWAAVAAWADEIAGAVTARRVPATEG